MGTTLREEKATLPSGEEIVKGYEWTSEERDTRDEAEKDLDKLGKVVKRHESTGQRLLTDVAGVREQDNKFVAYRYRRLWTGR